MASVQKRGDRYQLRVKNRLLPKPFFFTFETEPEAEAYGVQLESLLKRGIVPVELLNAQPTANDPLIYTVLGEYLQLAPITASDTKLMGLIETETRGVRVGDLTAVWVDEYVRELKVGANVAPSTIRKRIGLLGRVLDWHIRRVTPKGELPASNPLRQLPRGYSGYTAAEVAVLPTEKSVKHDVQRDRRLDKAEETQIRAMLAGTGRFRPKPELTLFFDLVLNTGLRLSEAYMLRVEWLHLDRGYMQVAGSKGHRGKLKPRTVPLVPALVTALRLWCAGRTGLVFSYWDGTPQGKLIATRDLVQLFGRLFRSAGVENLTEHDLRHEACCRWFEMRDKDGRWMFSDVEICRVMGWSNYSMILRYASLRGSDLASRFGT